MVPLLRIAAGLLLSSGTVLAQGSDACSTATPITGTGSFAFDSSQATTDGLPAAICDFAGTSAIEADVWFDWTAPSSGAFTLSTCGTASFDTKLAVYAGPSCGATPIACNDDDCGLQSSAAFTATQGAAYLLRVGSFPGEPGGSGFINVFEGSPCETGTTGPDVIVGLLNGIANWGGSNGVGAYSIGTDSCNVGDAELDWIANTSAHPVIAQNLYRLEGGRFEQIGLSWLKHGFAALQLELCCECTSASDSTRLGVGCSDPYGAGLNGSQVTLGPRFEVNAHTGSFNYPFFAQGQTGNQLYKRLRVANVDIDPALHPDAQYFAEGHYVAADDALAGNGNNNASYAEVMRGSFTDGAWSLAISGPTQREQSALHAWREHDPDVVLEPLQVPGEGLFTLGYKVSDNGDGTWHYEYALHNLNSHASGGAFEIPVPNAVGVTNIEFHGVAYHSGEPFDDTPWTATRLTQSLRWSTESFATNANANALRWGTLYNFRFDANAPPEAGTAVLDLFRPNTPSQVSALSLAPADDPTSCTGSIVNYCSATPNSSGQTAGIIAAGSTSLADNALTLTAFQMPPGQFGYFLMSNTQGFLPNLGGGAGNFCLGSPFRRFAGAITQVDAFGEINLALDFTNLPGGTVFLPGDEWNFQAWFRDIPVGNSNTTNGVRVRVCR